MKTHQNHKLVIGVDLGGTNIKAILTDLEGGIHARTAAKTHVERGVETVVDNLKKVVRTLLSKGGVSVTELAGIGIGSPGPLNSRQGVVINPPNFPDWHNVPLLKYMGEEFATRFFLDNDANAATFGEKWLGAGQKARTMVCYTLGTGVGGGIIIDGKLLRGPDDTGGELGHTTINFKGPLCSCGRPGHLEAYVSATAIVRRTHERIEKGEPTQLHEMTQGRLSRLTSRMVCEAASAGDRLAREIMQESGRLLGVGIANIVNALNPDMVVIAGGVVAAGELLFAPCRREVRRLAFPRPARRARIVPAALDELAGALGAAGICLQHLKLLELK